MCAPLVISRLMQYQLNPPHPLELEITETAKFIDKEYVVDILKTIKDMGINIVIDDFSTAFTSLTLTNYAYKSFPITLQFPLTYP